MPKKKNITEAWGIASFTLSLSGIILFLVPYIAIFLSALAIIFYGIQRKYKNTGLSTAGLIMGIIGCVINFIILLIMLVFITSF
jgi:hypothetical protein